MVKTSEMVERVAGAMNYAFECEGRVFNHGEAELLALAAVEAMREPTRAMFDAAATVDRYAQPGEEWEPMIDAALRG